MLGSPPFLIVFQFCYHLPFAPSCSISENFNLSLHYSHLVKICLFLNRDKEIIQDSQSPSTQPTGNDIMRPFKIQKLQTPLMVPVLQYQENINQQGASSCSGGHSKQSSPGEIVIQRADSSICNYRKAQLADPNSIDSSLPSSTQHWVSVPLGDWSGREK